MERLWHELQPHSEVLLKRQLWDGLLREAYGTAVGDDALFLQHTYLTIVAKTIAARVLDLPANDAAAILSGRALDDEGIQGAVESDFFDWILELANGRDLVLRIAQQTARFRLRDVEVDVLKSLYESLIDPAQRHDEVRADHRGSLGGIRAPGEPRHYRPRLQPTGEILLILA